MPLVRVVDAGLGPEAQTRLVVSGVSDPDRLRSSWASSGAIVERVGDRLHAVSTVAALGRAAGRSLTASEAQALEAGVRSAVRSWTGPTPPWELPSGPLELSSTVLMGVCNVTPDSFSDGGLIYPQGHPEAAVRLAQQMRDDGAAVIDVGGESTQPGAEPIDVEEELARTVPVVAALAAEGALVSIDTTKPEVAEAAVAAGAQIVNDVSGGSPALLDVVSRTGAGYVLMHSRATPAEMQRHTDYEDVVAEVYEFLEERLGGCAAAGIDPERVVVDPGIGFAKNAQQNLQLLRAVPQFRGLGRPVLVGTSRKSFIGRLLDGADVAERLEGSLATAALAVVDGAGVLRVHDVAETRRAVRVADALRTAAGPP